MTMIEKVARAIANELGHYTKFQIENHKDAARAAIEAMRELNGDWSLEYSYIWQTMINAALEGK